MKKIRPPCTPSNKTKNKKQEEDFCGKLLKKTPPEESGFQTGQFTGFLYRRSHGLDLDAAAVPRLLNKSFQLPQILTNSAEEP